MNFLYLMVEINILMPARRRKIYLKVTFEIFEEVDSDRFPIRSDEESPSWNGEYGYIPYV